MTRLIHVTYILFAFIIPIANGTALQPDRSTGTQGSNPAKQFLRIGTAQPKRRLIDYRLTATSKVLVEVDKTLEKLEQIMHKAGAVGCDALAFPEDTLGLGNWEAGNPTALDNVLPEALRRMLERLGRVAAKHNMYVVCCSDTIDKDGNVRNTAFFLGRDGTEIGHYDKVNMPIHELYKKRGGSFPVFDTPDLGGVGMLICYDMVFPEATRCLALGGADIIFNPTLGGAAFGDEGLNRAAFRVRAAENFVYVVVSKRGSGSMIISPIGEVLAEGKGPDDVAIADINPFGGREGGDAMNYQKDMRARIFRERWPTAFRILTDPHPPILEKVPQTITIKEAVRLARGALTIGEIRFKEADAMLREGKTNESIHAFEKLRADYPHTWIDRLARQRLRTIRR